jgi:hypothetical protein
MALKGPLARKGTDLKALRKLSHKTTEIGDAFKTVGVPKLPEGSRLRLPKFRLRLGDIGAGIPAVKNEVSDHG